MRQGKKFTTATKIAKRNIRLLRTTAGYSVFEGAKKLKVSRKQMEDIEATRNYGCYLGLDLLLGISLAYDVPIDSLLIDQSFAKKPLS